MADGMGWPPVAGEYFVLTGNRECHVAVSTLASVDLAAELADRAPPGLCVVGKTETENIGIEKVIRNTITNPSLHTLVLCGKDPEGHRSGATLLALCKNGIDKTSRVIGSPGRKPVLRNVTPGEVDAFRSQVTVVDLIGCEDAKETAGKIARLSGKRPRACRNDRFSRRVKPVAIKDVETVQAEKPSRLKLDKAGYFVILPLPDQGIIHVEHYSVDNRLLRVIEGNAAAQLYGTIVKNGWVTELGHAAYLGKELARAELSLAMPIKYVQDGA